jgi:hypothetical protein
MWEAVMGRMTPGSQLGQKGSKTQTQSISWEWCCASMIPARWEATGKNMAICSQPGAKTNTFMMQVGTQLRMMT